MLVGLVVSVKFDVPVRVRFSLNKRAFDAVVRDLEAAGSFDDWERLEVPDEIGDYRIYGGSRVRQNVILFEYHGAFLAPAGFAYLPYGPDDQLAAAGYLPPRFRHLTGDWYAGGEVGPW